MLTHVHFIFADQWCSGRVLPWDVPPNLRAVGELWCCAEAPALARRLVLARQPVSCGLCSIQTDPAAVQPNLGPAQDLLAPGCTLTEEDQMASWMLAALLPRHTCSLILFLTFLYRETLAL